jgi:ABC-type phosphate transport system permease subunit
VFDNTLVTIPWVVFVTGLFLIFGRPLSEALVVSWVKGVDAYSRQGIRIPKSKHPLHFTDGSRVAEMPYFLANLLIFLLIVGGLSLLLIRAIRFYEHHFKVSRTFQP